MSTQVSLTYLAKNIKLLNSHKVINGEMMTEFQLYALTGLGLYFLVMIVMGIVSAKTETHDGFVIGSRNVGLLPTLASITTSFRDGSGAVFWVGAGLGAAYGGLWLFVGLITASLFFILFGNKMRLVAKENNFITIGEVIRHFIGKATEKSASILILFFSLIAIAMQLYVSGNIFSEVVGLESSYGIIAVATVVGVYMLFGGYSTVIKTDFLQFFIILLLIIFPFIIRPEKADILDFSSFIEVDFELGVGLFMLGCFYVLSGAETWQRIFSARNATVARWSFPLSVIFLLFMTLCLVWVGMGVKPWLEGTDPSQALFALFSLTEHIPLWLLSAFAVILMAITMSTLDSFCYLFASSLGKNMLPAKMTDTREKYIKFARIVIAVILIIMSYVAMQIDDVVKVLFSSASLLYFLCPIYILSATGILKKSSWIDWYTTACLSLCTIGYIYMFIEGLTENLILAGLPAFIFLVLLLIAAVIQRLPLKR
jgi:SSS family solute:Na+ symporter